jgi:hypothetical protein
MFKLNDEFLEELGLGSLPKGHKKAFLRHIYSELESRVGSKLTDGMSNEQLDEFACFVNKDDTKMREWFAANLPDYADQPDYKKMKESAPDADETVLLSEYGATKWLRKNRPDYPKVVAAALEELRIEIKANKDQILE